MKNDFLLLLIRKHQVLIKYGVIGVLCALTDFLIFTFLTSSSMEVQYLYANIISVNVGILCSFFLNRHFTFKVKNKTMVRLLVFYSVGLAGLALSSFLLYTFVDVFFWNTIASKAITVLVVALFQFLLNKFITFKNR